MNTDTMTPDVSTQSRVNIRTAALADVFKSVTEIVDNEPTSVFAERNVTCDAFPNPEVLAHQANRLRPQDPTTLDFDVDTSFIPSNFFKQDVKVKQQRHLIFAMNEAMSDSIFVETW